jgi:hypothetical protein
MKEAQTLLTLVMEKASMQFGTRGVSIFKIGSLGSHGDFSPCSDVDVALMLDTLMPSDDVLIQSLIDEVKTTDLPYADVLSVFWSAYDLPSFTQGLGRFPPLDRLDLIEHGILLCGEDKRYLLTKPSYDELVLFSAKFILDYMLHGEKAEEIKFSPEVIAEKGARYFSKCVLFPARLLFTLENQDVIGSNKEAMHYFGEHIASRLTDGHDIRLLVQEAYACRSLPENQVVNIQSTDFGKLLLRLYLYCILQYHAYLQTHGHEVLATELKLQMQSLQQALDNHVNKTFS